MRIFTTIAILSLFLQAIVDGRGNAVQRNYCHILQSILDGNYIVLYLKIYTAPLKCM